MNNSFMSNYGVVAFKFRLSNQKIAEFIYPNSDKDNARRQFNKLRIKYKMR